MLYLGFFLSLPRWISFCNTEEALHTKITSHQGRSLIIVQKQHTHAFTLFAVLSIFVSISHIVRRWENARNIQIRLPVQKGSEFQKNVIRGVQNEWLKFWRAGGWNPGKSWEFFCSSRPHRI
jgi:hypothetical protein